MKDFILKNKKIIGVVSAVLSILFLILAISNLSSAERSAYQAMYDANNELYETYLDAAEKYNAYGYSSNAQECYSKANDLSYKLDKYQGELTKLNIQFAVYAFLSVGLLISAGYCLSALFKRKPNSNGLTEE